MIKIDLMNCNLSRDLTQDTSKLRNGIHLADTNIVGTGFDDDDDDDFIII